MERGTAAEYSSPLLEFFFVAVEELGTELIAVSWRAKGGVLLLARGKEDGDFVLALAPAPIPIVDI